MLRDEGRQFGRNGVRAFPAVGDAGALERACIFWLVAPVGLPIVVAVLGVGREGRARAGRGGAGLGAGGWATYRMCAASVCAGAVGRCV